MKQRQKQRASPAAIRLTNLNRVFTRNTMESARKLRKNTEMTSSFVEWWTPGVDTVTDSPIDAMVTQLIYGFSICHEIYQICTNYNRHSNLKYIFWNHTHWDKIKEKTLHFFYLQQKKNILYTEYLQNCISYKKKIEIYSIIVIAIPSSRLLHSYLFI